MSIKALRMPKWGLSMGQGTVAKWRVQVGQAVAPGDELVEVETDKIVNSIEADDSGILRRVLAHEGEVALVGAVIGILADESATDAEIDAFIAALEALPTPSDDLDPLAGPAHILNVAVDDHLLRVVRVAAADRESLVLIHGFAGDANNWQLMIPSFVETLDVIAVDLPGHGNSSRGVGDGSVSMFADTVRRALAALKVDRYHLVGHSLGAAVAAKVASDDVNSVASLTLICPVGVSRTVINQDFVRGIIQSNRARDLRRWLELLVAEPSLIGRAMVEDMLRYKRLDGVPEALAIVGERLIGGSDLALFRDQLERLPPSLVIASHSDSVVGTPDKSALPQGIRLELMKGVGHMPHIEKAAEVARLIQQQIDGHYWNS